MLLYNEYEKEYDSKFVVFMKKKKGGSVNVKRDEDCPDVVRDHSNG